MNVKEDEGNQTEKVKQEKEVWLTLYCRKLIHCDYHIMTIIVIILQMLLVTDYYERGSLYDYLQITVLDVEAMARFVIIIIIMIIIIMMMIIINMIII